MKNYLAVLLLLLVSSVSAQEYYSYSGWGKVRDSNGRKVSSQEIRFMNENNFEISNLYNTGKMKQVVGNIFIYGGSAFFVGYTAIGLTTATHVNSYALVAGGVVALIGIPIRIGFKRKIEQALHMMNDIEKEKAHSSLYIKSYDIIANGNGIGISLTF